MDFFCDVSDKVIKLKSRYKHFLSNTHKQFDKCKRMQLTVENPDINNVDEVFNAYNIQHKKDNDYYRIQCHFKLVFNDNQNSTYVKCNFLIKKLMISWQKFLEKVIDNFKNNGYNFNHIDERNIITIARKMDLTYDFYIKHNMSALEWN